MPIFLARSDKRAWKQTHLGSNKHAQILVSDATF